MSDIQKILRKLDKPPAGPNFVRFVNDNPVATAKRLVSFAIGMPPFHYRHSYLLMRDQIEHRIGFETALKAIAGKGSPSGHPHNESLLRAFFDWDKHRQYSASNPIGFERAFFRVSREIVVPIEPLSVIREHGKFVTVFACGWNDLALDLVQRRLLRTVCEDAFLSLTDYLDSPAEYLFFPRVREEKMLVKGETRTPKQFVRKPEVWQRADYEMLSKSDLNELIQIFLQGREMAREILQDMASRGRFTKEHQKQEKDADRSKGGLFG